MQRSVDGDPSMSAVRAGHGDDRPGDSFAMAYRILCVEPSYAPMGDTLAVCLNAAAGFRVERADWNRVIVEGLAPYAMDVILAVVVARAAEAAEVFRWLRHGPVDVPTLAVLPDAPDDELLRCVVDAADDFTVWPVHALELRHRIARLVGPERMASASVQRQLTDAVGLSQLVGVDPQFTRMVEQLPLIAESDAPVLITGETGTGKELCACAIHQMSRRRHAPFVAVDCAALPDHLFENELFGHARGAFTDAHRDQRGLAASADGGTLFLDEIDALSLTAQAKLLRFLQGRTFKPLGSERTLHADVNVIAATNRDLEASVRDRQFRADLYFRLNVMRLQVPPLRERRGDITVLATHFLQRLRSPHGAPRRAFSSAALRTLVHYDWPGNVRELLNVVQRAAVFSTGRDILPHHLSLPAGAPAPGPSFRAAKASAVAVFERTYVETLLHKHLGNVTAAAHEARKDRRVFVRLLRKYGIAPRDAAAARGDSGATAGH
jgi:two-component system response regulator GlrR